MTTVQAQTTQAEATIPAGVWKSDPVHSSVGFLVKHMVVATFRGAFTDFGNLQKALEEKKANALDRWFNTKISSYYIMVDDEFKGCEEMKKWTTAANSTGKN